MSTEEKSVPNASNDSGNDQPKESSRPKNVPLRLWEKFQALEKRTNEVTKRSTEKRIKHLQKTALENVARALPDPADQALVHLPPVTHSDHSTSGHPSTTTTSSTSSPGSSSLTPSAVAASRKRPADHAVTTGTSQEDEGPSKETRLAGGEEKEEKDWEAVRGLMGVNDHLAGVSHGSLGPRTVLELQIDDAIAGGDFGKAEELSDYMATREFGEKVAKAIDAKNFLDHKQEEEEVAKAKRKKKLSWGFEPKHRWETKGNM